MSEVKDGARGLRKDKLLTLLESADEAGAKRGSDEAPDTDAAEVKVEASNDVGDSCFSTVEDGGAAADLGKELLVGNAGTDRAGSELEGEDDG